MSAPEEKPEQPLAEVAADESVVVPSEGATEKPWDEKGEEEEPLFIPAGETVEVDFGDNDAPPSDDGGDDGEGEGEDELERQKGEVTDAALHEEPCIDMSEFTLTEHVDAVMAVALHPTDLDLFATGSTDEKAFLWRREGGTAVKVAALDGHTDSVVALSFSADGKYLASASCDGGVKVWTSEGVLLHALDGPTQDVEWLKWHPKGAALLAGCADTTAWMWWAPSGKLMQVFAGHGDRVTCGTFAMDGKSIATGSQDGGMIVWKPKDGVPDLSMRNLHQAPITSIAAHPSQPFVCTGGEDGTCLLVHMTSGKILHTIGGFGDAVEAIEFAPDGSSILAIGGLDGQIQVFDYNRGMMRCAMMEHSENGGIVRLQWHPSAPLLLTCSTDKTLRIFDARVGQCVKTLTGHDDGVLDMSVQLIKTPGSNGSLRIVSGSDDSTVKVWTVDIYG